MQVVADVLGGGIDLVGDAGGQFADGFELLGHGQLAFQGLAFADVEDDLEKAQLAPALGRDHGLDDRQDAAVGTRQAHFLIEDVALGQHRAGRQGPAFGVAPDDVAAALADEFLPGAAAQLLGHGIDVLHHLAARVNDEDAGPDAGQDAAQHFLLVAQVLFHPLAVGDVGGDADNALGHAGGVLEPGPVEDQMALAAPGVLQGHLELLHPALGEDLPVALGQVVADLVGKDRPGRQALGAFDGDAEKGGKGAVDADVVAGGVLDVDGIDGGVHEAFEHGQPFAHVLAALAGGPVQGHGQDRAGHGQGEQGGRPQVGQGGQKGRVAALGQTHGGQPAHPPVAQDAFGRFQSARGRRQHPGHGPGRRGLQGTDDMPQGRKLPGQPVGNPGPGRGQHHARAVVVSAVHASYRLMGWVFGTLPDTRPQWRRRSSVIWRPTPGSRPGRSPRPRPPDRPG